VAYPEIPHFCITRRAAGDVCSVVSVNFSQRASGNIMMPPMFLLLHFVFPEACSTCQPQSSMTYRRSTRSISASCCKQKSKAGTHRTILVFSSRFTLDLLHKAHMVSKLMSYVDLCGGVARNCIIASEWVWI